MSKLLSISEAAKALGVSESTLRRWEREGRLLPDERTVGGQRRYKLSSIRPQISHVSFLERKTIAYACVSSHDQKNDLEQQKQVLELYCSSQGWQFEILSDLGSGINYNKKNLKVLIQSIIDNEVGRLVLTHKDRLLRFGAELIFSICEVRQVEIVIINQGDISTFEEDLAKDVLEIITVFSARLYGSRSGKNQKLIDGMTKAVEESIK